MKICLIGKFPPIQGGVSTRGYAFAHSLAQQGHQVHVVTNAKDVRVPFRLHMRPEDWDKCEADYGDGFVRVHWTDRADAGQYHIPMSPAYVTKLSSLAIEVCAEHDIDIIFGFYMEPYGIAAYLASIAASVPYVLKTAGSDAGRLWHQSQFRPVYDHVFRSARRVIAGGFIRDELMEIGVERRNIWPDPSFTVPEDIFTPDAKPLDVQELLTATIEDPQFSQMAFGQYREDLAYIGVYGKLGEKKGSFALLEALRKLIDRNIDAGLLVLGQERPRSRTEFRKVVHKLNLEDHVVQLPFIPNWRVPEFISRCVAVCALEQDFPIEAHAPITPREILVAGGCIVSSFEMLSKLPSPQRLISGFNCLAVENVFDTAALADTLQKVLDAPDLAMQVGIEARSYALAEQAFMPFPDRLSEILSSALTPDDNSDAAHTGSQASNKHRNEAGDTKYETINTDRAQEIQKEIDLISKTIESAQTSAIDEHNKFLKKSIARYRGGAALFDRREMESLCPAQVQTLSSCDLRFDGNELLQYLSSGTSRRSYTECSNSLVVTQSPNGDLRVLVLDTPMTHVFRNCDGENTVANIANQAGSFCDGLEEVENIVLELLRNNLISISVG